MLNLVEQGFRSSAERQAFVERLEKFFFLRFHDKRPVTLLERHIYHELLRARSWRERFSYDSFYQRLMRENKSMLLEVEIQENEVLAVVPENLKQVRITVYGANLLQNITKIGFLELITDKRIFLRFSFENPAAVADKKLRGRSHFFMKFDVENGEGDDESFLLFIKSEDLAKLKQLGKKLNPAIQYKETTTDG